MPLYKLTYLNKRGNGEILRLIFVAARQKYEDERLTEDEADRRRESFPMKTSPVLTIDGETVLGQAPAIARYLAKQFGLFGSNLTEEFLIDEICESVAAVWRDMIAYYFETDKEKKENMHQRLYQGTMRDKFYCYIKKRLEDNTSNGNGYLVGAALSLADLAVFNLVNSTFLISGRPIWDSFPEIKQHHDRIASNPDISDWLEKRPITRV